MGNYQKIPVQVDAAKVSDIIPLATSNWAALPAWVQTQYTNGSIVFGAAYLIINGGEVAAMDDWLVQNADGTLCHCTSTDFPATYEAVV